MASLVIKVNESIVFYQFRSAEKDELKTWMMGKYFRFATCIMPKTIDSLKKFRRVYIDLNPIARPLSLALSMSSECRIFPSFYRMSIHFVLTQY